MTRASGSARIGLIADTHGLVRPQALAALHGVDRVLHAGDVGKPEVLEALERVAPVTAVRGNVDHGAWADALPRTAEVDSCGHWIHMLHIIEELELDPVAAGFAAVIYGHSHRPSAEKRDGVLYVNPGSAGPRRFTLPVSVALLEVDGSGPRVELIALEP